MSFDLGLGRIAIFVVCIAVLGFIGGFDPPAGVPPRAWGGALMMFFMGAVCVSVIEHSVGHMEPRTNLRFAYIILGVLLMVGAGILMQGMRGAHSEG